MNDPDLINQEALDTAPTLSIIPLGGIGEIGMNCTLLECGDDIIVIDAGLMFPDPEMLGVDIVIPDFTYLYENRHKVRAIVLTHAHEDHIGALPFLLRELNVPVYGTRLTLGFVKDKLKEHGLDETGHADHGPAPRGRRASAAFRVEFIRVTHSIVDGVGLGITTPVGRVVHTGDFKIDPTPVDNEVMDLRTFSGVRRPGDAGVPVRQHQRPAGRATPSRRRRSGGGSRRSSRRRRAGSSWPPSPRTSTASSRSWTWP